jgi:hypothetical protein
MSFPALALPRSHAARSLGPREERERWRTRRAALAWGLLYLNVATFYGPGLLHIPTILGKLVTQGALPVAILVLLTVNRKLTVRPNFFLCLVTLLLLETVIGALAPEHFGTVYRTFRLAEFVAALWLLTPWWGRNDLILVRAHLTCLSVLLISATLGIVVAPGQAFTEGRLQGIIWIIPPTQVAHYAAIAIGLVIVLWFGGLMRGRTAAIITVAYGILMILTHTRTALTGMVAGIIVAGLSMITASARVRRFFAAAATACGLAVISASSALSNWLARGESAQGLSSFSGRTSVWGPLLAFPRNRFEELFGFGLSNSSFNGLAIDSTWMSTYLEQGIIGCVISGMMLLFLLLTAYFQPRGVKRAIALFLVTYCLIASFTEDGFSDATSYLLDLTLAASCLVPYVRAKAPHVSLAGTRLSPRSTPQPPRSAPPAPAAPSEPPGPAVPSRPPALSD